MSRIFVFLVLAFGLVGCTNGIVPASATVAPTQEPTRGELVEPTATLPPTAVPTNVPKVAPTSMPMEIPTEVSATEPPSEMVVVIMNPAEIMKYVSEEMVLAECLDVYPTDMDMFELGSWASKYSEYLVLKGTGEDANPKNSPMYFSLPLNLKSDPRCVAALYFDHEGNAFLLYEISPGEVKKLFLVPSEEPILTPTPELWDADTAVNLMLSECLIVDFGYGSSKFYEYSRDLRNRSGLPTDLYLDPTYWMDLPRGNCVFLQSAPRGKNAVLVYETTEGEIRILYTTPIR